MYNILILVADQSRARLYGTETVHATPVEIEGFSNVAGKRREQDLVSNAPGRASSPAGAFPHVISNENEAHLHALDQFAKNIVTELESILLSAPRTSLYLIAGPRFLGILRNKMSPNVEKHIAGELHKDLTNIPATELPGYIKIINSVHA